MDICPPDVLEAAYRVDMHLSMNAIAGTELKAAYSPAETLANTHMHMLTVRFYTAAGWKKPKKSGADTRVLTCRHSGTSLERFRTPVHV